MDEVSIYLDHTAARFLDCTTSNSTRRYCVDILDDLEVRLQSLTIKNPTREKPKLTVTFVGTRHGRPVRAAAYAETIDEAMIEITEELEGRFTVLEQ